MKKPSGESERVCRISVPCFFRCRGRSREFTSPGNFDALNLLKNKLDGKKISDRRGRLVFEFDPTAKKISKEREKKIKE